MKKSIRAIFIIVLIYVMTILSVETLAEPTGMIMVHKEPVTAGESLNASKSAQGSLVSIGSLIAYGDATIEDIAKKGDISKVHFVDKKVIKILFFFRLETFTVYGE